MRAADPGNVDYLPLDQLDAVLTRQESGLGHLMAIADAEPVPQRRLGAFERGLHG